MTGRRVLGWAAFAFFATWLVNDIVYTHSPAGKAWARKYEGDDT